MIKSFAELENVNLDHRKIAVVWPSDIQTVKAVEKAKNSNGIIPYLIGDVRTIQSLIEEDKDTIIIQPAATPEEAAEIAVQLAKNGEIHAIMKGKMDTSMLLKAVIKEIRTDRLMNHFVINEISTYHKILAVSDGGMNLYPSLQEKKKIIENSVAALHKLGTKVPKVAVLASVEKVNPKMPETIEAKALKEMNESGELPGCIIEGPISYDLAMSQESAEIKGYESPVTGDVDLLIVPNIQVGNILGKSLVYSANAKMAGVILGAKVPIILTSRGSSFEEKYYSILLSGKV